MAVTAHHPRGAHAAAHPFPGHRSRPQAWPHPPSGRSDDARLSIDRTGTRRPGPVPDAGSMMRQ